MNALASSSASRPPPIVGQGDLLARLGAAGANDCCRGMFFNGALNAVRTHVGDAAVERCRSLAGEKKFTDFFNYPITAFLKLAFEAVELLAPKVGGAEMAWRLLGKQAVDDFLASPSGKTMLLIAGQHPKRMILATPSGFKAAVSYGERSVIFSDLTTCALTMKGDFMPPAYHEGVLATVLTATGAKSVRVTGRPLGLLDAEYAIAWE